MDRSVIDVLLVHLNVLVINIAQIRTLWEEHSNQSNSVLNGSFILSGVRVGKAHDNMAQAASAASKDARFLEKSSEKEGATLSDGKEKMKNLRYFARNLGNKRKK